MSFTDRMNIEIPECPISIRNEAPVEFRLYLLQLMLQYFSTACLAYSEHVG